MPAPLAAARRPPMREMWIVIKREFRERVRTRAFVLSTILLPLFTVGIFVVPYLMDRAGSGSEYRIVVVDGTPDGIGERVVASLTAPPASERDDVIHAERIARPLEAVRDSLTAAARAEELDGFVWLGEDFLETGAVLYRSRIVTNMALNQRLRVAASEAVQAERLDRAGLDGGAVAAILLPAQLETSQITRTGEGGGDAQSTMMLAYIITFVLYLFIILYGTQVMQSVHEEKGNRIAEVLMSSLRAPHLLVGKVFGVGGAALVQMAVWGSLLAIAALQRERIAAALDMPIEALGALQIDPLIGFLLLLFALLGFFLYAALFAVAGAATQDMHDAQQFVWILLMPLILPMVMQFQIISQPHGALATALSWIPFTSPLAVPLRMGATEVSAVEIAGSLAVLALTIAVVSWMAGKIYRVGMLSTGKRASLTDLWQWVRTA
jgi:ABC-2 type transport system permease protein